jgi:hypothetical protein
MATSPTSSVAERVVQQRQYGRTQPVVVEATPDGLAYRRAGSPVLPRPSSSSPCGAPVAGADLTRSHGSWRARRTARTCLAE